MAARKEFPVKVRRVAVTNKKTGVKYIEERRYQYDPAKGYNVLLSSRRTGEKILEGETVTTRCRPKKKPAEAAQTAELSAKRTRVGALDLIRHAGAVAGLESSVRRAYPNGGTSEKLLSVSQYLVSTGETVHNVEAWQCEHDLPYEAGLSEDICYDLFHELGLDESGSQSLFRELARTAGNDEQPAIAFDSTSHSVYGNGLKPYARQGFNKDGDGLDIYKIITFYSLDSGLPVSFELQPGNIPRRDFSRQCRASGQGIRLEESGVLPRQRVLQQGKRAALPAQEFQVHDPRHAQARLDLQALGQRHR